MNDIKRLVVVACGAVVLLLLCLFVKNHADVEGWKTAYKYNIAIIATKQDAFNYDVDSHQGLVLSRGPFKTAQGVKFDEMAKTYTYVEKVHEQYTMHVETYSCGTSKHPRTCTRTYYSWDRKGSDERYSDKIYYFDRGYSTRLFSFRKLITSEGKYYYRDNDNRYYYNVVPLAFTASFLADTSQGLDNPFGGAVLLETKPIEQMKKDATGYKVLNNIGLTMAAIMVLIAMGIVGYTWVMSDGKWSLRE